MSSLQDSPSMEAEIRSENNLLVVRRCGGIDEGGWLKSLGGNHMTIIRAVMEFIANSRDKGADKFMIHILDTCILFIDTGNGMTEQKLADSAQTYKHDDALADVTGRYGAGFINGHKFLGKGGLVEVITKHNDEEGYKMSIPWDEIMRTFQYDNNLTISRWDENDRACFNEHVVDDLGSATGTIIKIPHCAEIEKELGKHFKIPIGDTDMNRTDCLAFKVGSMGIDVTYADRDGRYTLEPYQPFMPCEENDFYEGIGEGTIAAFGHDGKIHFGLEESQAGESVYTAQKQNTGTGSWASEPLSAAITGVPRVATLTVQTGMLTADSYYDPVNAPQKKPCLTTDSRPDAYTQKYYGDGKAISHSDAYNGAADMKIMGMEIGKYRLVHKISSRGTAAYSTKNNRTTYKEEGMKKWLHAMMLTQIDVKTPMNDCLFNETMGFAATKTVYSPDYNLLTPLTKLVEKIKLKQRNKIWTAIKARIKRAESAPLVQRIIRGYLARKRLPEERARRDAEKRVRELMERCAVTKIQRRWRAARLPTRPAPAPVSPPAPAPVFPPAPAPVSPPAPAPVFPPAPASVFPLAPVHVSPPVPAPVSPPVPPAAPSLVRSHLRNQPRTRREFWEWARKFARDIDEHASEIDADMADSGGLVVVAAVTHCPKIDEIMAGLLDGNET